MDSTDTTAPAPDADDMLAQLAGDEIDRLLAEAEADAPPSPSPSAAPAHMPDVDPTPASEFARPMESIPSAKSDAATLSIDQVLGEAAAVESSPPAPQPASAEVSITETETAPVANSFSEPAPAEAEKATANIAPPVAVDPTPASASIPAAAAPSTGFNPQIIVGDDEARPFPFYVRLLDFILDPLDAIPDSLLNVMGKFAIVTLMNAVGMLIYVKVFRHHHK